MKILFVFTGGTIGSTLNGSVMSVDNSKSYKILDAYDKKFAIDFEYECACPYLELSENNTGDNLSLLCSCICENANKGYDGIIVTHGTDTLQYSASAIAYTLTNPLLPVCVVSASYPIEHAKTNALDNLHSAILVIKNKLGKGVFVPFRNTKDKIIKLHKATRLLPSIPYSDEVKSVDNREYGYFTSDFTFIKNNNFTAQNSESSPFAPLFSSRSSVLLLHAYPGMNYPVLTENIKYVLLLPYHSGTVDTKSKSAIEFYNTAKSKDIKVFISGVKQGDEYESATLFSSLSITPIFDLSPISAFIKLWLIASQNKSEDLLFLPLGEDK